MRWIKPDWPLPENIQAISTTRQGGVSLPPYASLNFGLHVDDVEAHVLENRRYLCDSLSLPEEPFWLDQTHSTVVVDVDSNNCETVADASISRQLGKVCVVMTADCLPVLLSSKEGTVIAAAHAGWRGLNDGILEATISKMEVATQDLYAWLGPAIGSERFEVGTEVRRAFLANNFESEKAFKPGLVKGKWLADIYSLARIRLNALGVVNIYGGGFCTYTDKERFFSYRREKKTGRMASLIWMKA